LATQHAIEEIESYAWGDPSEEVMRAITLAQESGDPSRKADAQISLHLESCAMSIRHYWHVREIQTKIQDLEAHTYMLKHGTPPARGRICETEIIGRRGG